MPAANWKVHKLRQALGEIAIPFEAIAGIAYEPARKGGRLRLRMREGADPFIQVAAGRLADAADPYRLFVEAGRTGVAEYFADQLRTTLQLEGVPAGPTNRYLMPGPGIPVTGGGTEGTAEFDGESIRLAWNWGAPAAKTAAGPQRIELAELESVDWAPSSGMGYGRLQFHVKGARLNLPITHDPYALRLTGFEKENWSTLLVAAAILARLPHPAADTAVPEAGALRLREGGRPDRDDTSAELLRQLRELGDLYRDGILTEDEFTAAKQSLLPRLHAANRLPEDS
ncbi:hypothetical protein Nans01_20520 [Nocardiopsis ansamitocini]|uniref:DUF4429 domain-containing protein n=1 Tax=Nocardiopsis ansamitocini TaxID=1670832 RepID=A0A9W6UGL1_9ACTN|nr:hypothetical protein Nans01_20520 [Nocardiopsis ansamitocini]